MFRFRLQVVLLMSIALFAVACRSGKNSQFPYAREYDPRRQPYIVGVADTLRINVWRDPELSTEATVRPDGTLTMPLVGELRAAGRTTAELTKELRERVGRFVKDAVVTVAVIEVNSYRFTVSGNVGHPGVFSSRYYVTVSEALALAGGPNRYANMDDITIVRTDRDGKIRRIPIDYEAILEGEALEQDIVVLAGDAIIVP